MLHDRFQEAGTNLRHHRRGTHADTPLPYGPGSFLNWLSWWDKYIPRHTTTFLYQRTLMALSSLPTHETFFTNDQNYFLVIESTQTPKENTDSYRATSFQSFLSTSTVVRGLLKTVWRYNKEFFRWLISSISGASIFLLCFLFWHNDCL